MIDMLLLGAFVTMLIILSPYIMIGLGAIFEAVFVVVVIALGFVAVVAVGLYALGRKVYGKLKKRFKK